jgi:hypothetical protein
MVLILFSVITSCRKEPFYNVRSAVVINGGDEQVDGCGWLIEISNHTYKPQFLPEEFRVNNLKVLVKYSLLEEKADCGWWQDAFDAIAIEDIRMD